MRVEGLEIVAKSTVVAVQSSGDGTSWVNLPDANGSIDCAQITVHNNTGTTLEVGYGTAGGSAPSGQTYRQITGTSRTYRGLRDSRNLFLRRADLDATQVDIYAIAEAVAGT